MKNTLVLLLFLPWLGEAQIIKQNIPDKLVVLTFDDASASQYSVVAQWLKEFQFEATFFICEFPPNFSDTTKYMSWRQIKTLHEMGFEVANHTQHHYNVAQLTKAKFTEELCYIENKCDSLHISKPGSFAYPGYGVNISAINTLNEKGYRFARVGGSRAYNPLSDHPLLIPSWALNAENQAEIMAALHQAQNGKIVVLTIQEFLMQNTPG